MMGFLAEVGGTSLNSTTDVLQVITAIFSGCSSLLGGYLAYKVAALNFQARDHQQGLEKLEVQVNSNQERLERRLISEGEKAAEAAEAKGALRGKAEAVAASATKAAGALEERMVQEALHKSPPEAS